MQTLKTVSLQDSLLLETDISEAVNVADHLDVAVESDLGVAKFVTKSGTVDIKVKGGTVVYGSTVFIAGRIYMGTLFYYVDPLTGLKSKEYKWVEKLSVEFGKLGAFKSFSIVPSTQGDSTILVTLHWEEPDNIVNVADHNNDATWSYTIVVRKKGSSRPSCPEDGEIVGMSSIRGQYKSGIGFIDQFRSADTLAYSYNIFAITKGNQYTGLDGSEPTPMDWNAIKAKIADGKAGEVFAIGDIVTVNNQFFGNIELQVVAFDNADVPGSNHSVTFMSHNTLFKAAYDVSERILSDANVLNPGDKISDPYKACSVRGRANWLQSNIRQWLNGKGKYILSTDTIYDLEKYYFTKDTTTGKYTVVQDPADVYSVNPSALGYYEITFEPVGALYVETVEDKVVLHGNFGEVKDERLPAYETKVEAVGDVNIMSDNTEMAAQHDWDRIPDTNNTSDAAYVYNGKVVPCFLSGFETDFLNVLSKTNTKTIKDPFIGPDKEDYEVTSDYVFIPSYREIFGVEPDGLKAYNVHEGEQFTFFKPSVDIPELGVDRSHLKYDSSGVISGYYLRTIETYPSPTSGGYSIQTASGLYYVKNNNLTERPSIDVDPSTIIDKRAAHMTKEESILATSPGIAWCVVIAG